MDRRSELSIRETATRLRCTLKYVLDLVYAGKLPGARKLRNRWQIPTAAVTNWLARRKVRGSNR